MTIQVNIAEAKAKLSALIDAALRGEVVIIARNGQPVAHISALAPKRAIRFGGLKDYGWKGDTPYDVLGPEPEHEIDAPLIAGVDER
ncbi:MAG: type II toxin-antitoxin system Phd/YefM family antitoxin [Parvularculaceae bacterium]